MWSTIQRSMGYLPRDVRVTGQSHTHRSRSATLTAATDPTVQRPSERADHLVGHRGPAHRLAGRPPAATVARVPRRLPRVQDRPGGRAVPGGARGEPNRNEERVRGRQAAAAAQLVVYTPVRSWCTQRTRVSPAVILFVVAMDHIILRYRVFRCDGTSVPNSPRVRSGRLCFTRLRGWRLLHGADHASLLVP